MSLALFYDLYPTVAEDIHCLFVMLFFHNELRLSGVSIVSKVRKGLATLLLHGPAGQSPTLCVPLLTCPDSVEPPTLPPFLLPQQSPDIFLPTEKAISLWLCVDHVCVIENFAPSRCVYLAVI